MTLIDLTDSLCRGPHINQANRTTKINWRSWRFPYYIEQVITEMNVLPAVANERYHCRTKFYRRYYSTSENRFLARLIPSEIFVWLLVTSALTRTQSFHGGSDKCVCKDELQSPPIAGIPYERHNRCLMTSFATDNGAMMSIENAFGSLKQGFSTTGLGPFAIDGIIAAVDFNFVSMVSASFPIINGLPTIEGTEFVEVQRGSCGSESNIPRHLRTMHPQLSLELSNCSRFRAHT